jgi:diguanylate cyclase (GGDEF)-like protein
VSTEPSKLLRCIGKSSEIANSISKGSRAAILSMDLDTRSLSNPGLPRLRLPKEKEIMDERFQTLLKEANRELAGLLRDVGTPPCSAPLTGGENQLPSDLLMRAIRCAAKQYILQTELGNLALKDHLTGTYNRRGFQALAERQLKLGLRSGRGMLLFFVDVDGLKQINDSFGHGQGDEALKRTAEILRKTFRESDLIARLGGDEFAALAIEASGRNQAAIMDRLHKYLNLMNCGETRCKISFSVGMARFDRGRHASIGDLMAQADHAMYEIKRGRSRASATSGNVCRTQ